jgi:2-(1,2-epoxy-1,2-dihydrophenyl)acetyl-CoA isomerase
MMLQPSAGHAKLAAREIPEKRPMPDLIETVEDGVATLTLNRPENLNALSEDIRLGLLEAIHRLGADDQVGCIVLTGAGRGFCAGGDVKTMAGRSARGFEERAAGIQQSNRIPMLMHNTPKVIIGMINGVAAGAGLSMACACDLRIAARSARFTAAFIKIGLSGDWGGTWTLTRLVGTAKAREMFFTGDMVGADEAARIGLVNKVVDDAELLGTTMELARRIAAMPRIAMGYTKRNLAVAETGDFATSLEMEAFNQARCSQLEDHREAVQAFKEKRRPVFQGR